MKNKIIVMVLGILISIQMLIADEYTPQQKRELGQKVLHEMMQKIFSKTMEAKRYYLSHEQFRDEEDIIYNFATTAPRSEFIIQADISAELQEGAESAKVYVSTDNQATWQTAEAFLLGTEGYENTWSGTISTGDGNSAYAYLSGIVNSAALGPDYDYGTIIVSGTPHNINGNWPPGSNLYAPMVDEPSGDASSNYDITALHGTYKGNDAVDGDGNEYTDIERIYMKLTLDGNCCDEGGLFGPWYLYGVGIVNPDADDTDALGAGTAYAIGYGDGGFGQLTPGVLKITGDLSTGEIDDFEYLTTNISYSTSGNDMQATALMSYITNDSDWGAWPNSFNGFIVLGMTVEAYLDGLDVTAVILDETNPGLMVCTTTFQDGNIPLQLSNPEFDPETNTLSVTYSDGDGNLPWIKSVSVCDDPENCTQDPEVTLDMIPDGHTYEEGVRFSASFLSEDVPDGDYEAHFWFADDDSEFYLEPQIALPISVGVGCSLQGDLNDDGNLNVLDVVILVNLVLVSSDGDECSDINSDGNINVLDIVSLVNLVLG